MSLSSNCTKQIGEATEIREEADLAVKLDRASYVPYYEQIVSQLRDAIRTNTLSPGPSLWSQRELAELLGISVLPVKRALERLRIEGLLVTAKGKRPIVGAGNTPWNFQDLWSFSEEMKSQGFVPSTPLLRPESSRCADDRRV